MSFGQFCIVSCCDKSMLDNEVIVTIVVSSVASVCDAFHLPEDALLHPTNLMTWEKRRFAKSHPPNKLTGHPLGLKCVMAVNNIDLSTLDDKAKDHEREEGQPQPAAFPDDDEDEASLDSVSKSNMEGEVIDNSTVVVNVSDGSLTRDGKKQVE